MSKVKFRKAISQNSDRIVYHLWIGNSKSGYFVYTNSRQDESPEHFVWVKKGFLKDPNNSYQHLAFTNLSEAKHECVRQYNVENNIS